MQDKITYPGLHQDTHGMTVLGRVVLDGWLFGLIPETEDCAGWDLQRMQNLMNQVEQVWDQYGNLPSRLPPELRERHTKLYDMATERARRRGWDPELDEDE
jgi:hypothetical protein